MDYCSPGSSVHRILQERILEWVAIPFSRGSSQPRDWTWVSCTAGGFFTVWATRDAHNIQGPWAVVLRFTLHSSTAQILPVWVYAAVNRSACPHGAHTPGGETDKEGRSKSSEEQLSSSGWTRNTEAQKPGRGGQERRVLPIWLRSKEFACQCSRHRLDPWIGKIPWRRKWQPTAVFLPGKSHGQKGLVGYSSWSRKESDMTERLTVSLFFFHLSNYRQKIKPNVGERKRKGSTPER